MKLFLVRHAIAAQLSSGGLASDVQRPLTEEGKLQMQMVAYGLKSLGIKPDVILTSPLLRTEQTTEILAAVLGGNNIIETTKALAPGRSSSDVYQALKKYAAAKEVVLVGHEPNLSNLATALLWADTSFIMQFKKAGVCRIDITDVPPTSPGILKWLITPKIISLGQGN